jgi:two-component system, OmpR family, KDP operon response regulator KdpE
LQQKKSKILIVDDEPQILKMLNILLNVEGFDVVESSNGKQAIRMAMSTKPDLILLDIDLPDMNGMEIIPTLREWSHVPIIVLSAHSSDNEVAAALNIGANDYIIKPFNVDVMMARINAALRNAAIQEAGEPEINNGHLKMDIVRHEVYINGIKTAFTPKEYDLLRFFMANCGKMLTHRDILKKIWGAAHSEDTTYLRVYIGQIREKIEINPSKPVYIVTEAGIGYRMEKIPFSH